jgi:hypothetical protein
VKPKDSRYSTDFQVVGARAFFGTNADAAGAAFSPIKSWAAHPQYDGAVTSPYDIAVVVLESPSSVAPIPINRGALGAATVGAAVTSVGFGKTKSSDGFALGTKRSVTTKVTAVDKNGAHFSYGAAGTTTCQGDSGGPELLDLGGKATLAGVTSYGPSPCESGPATAVRVDAHLAFVDKYLGTAAPPPSSTTPPPPPPPSGGTTSYQCCINAQCYVCPDKAAYDKCAGFDVGACFSACGSDVACFSACNAKANASTKDPSSCTKK